MCLQKNDIGHSKVFIVNKSKIVNFLKILLDAFRIGPTIAEVPEEGAGGKFKPKNPARF